MGMLNIRYRLCAAALLIAGLVMCGPADAIRIKNLCEIQGARGNALKGIGIIVGLAGTGDGAADAARAQEEILRRMGIQVENRSDLSTENAAIVIVSAVIPPFAKEGTRIDVQVSSLYDAESIEGGTLMETMLLGADNQVYALAQGPVSIGGFNVDGGGGNSARNNHVTAGRIPMGAYVEAEIPSRITDGERIMLALKRPDFGTAENLQTAINAKYGPGTASALGAGTVSITIPADRRSNLVNFIAEVQDINVESDVRSRVVINERTGTIVVGGEVMIRPCHVAHGGLTIRISSIPVVSQPPIFSQGETVATDEILLEVEEESGTLMPLEGVSAAEVAQGLNNLKVTPRDMITIFQVLREAGVMDADLEIM